MFTCVIIFCCCMLFGRFVALVPKPAHMSMEILSTLLESMKLKLYNWIKQRQQEKCRIVSESTAKRISNHSDKNVKFVKVLILLLNQLNQNKRCKNIPVNFSFIRIYVYVTIQLSADRESSLASRQITQIRNNGYSHRWPYVKRLIHMG